MSLKVTLGNKEYFKNIGKIKYEGPQSTNPLSFKFYDENKVVAGKSMKDHLRFAIAYWHTFCGTGADPFGPGTINFPWDHKHNELEAAKDKLDAAFEFFTKLGTPFYCFHDTDMVPFGNNLEEYENNMLLFTDLAKAKQQESGVQLLWATQNLFSDPRYMNGAATNPDFQVIPFAAAQVKAILDMSVKLGGINHTFWGGRDGYFSLLNTDMKRELDHLGLFLSKARDYGRKIGFTGTFLIEPKPMEPTKHQYDFDTATLIGFLKEYGLDKDFKINIENNHATLAGHTFAHEIQTAIDAGLFGSLDVNQGDPHNGWDTDEFLHNIYEAVELWLILLQNGGIGHGGLNFDAKTRRNSTDLEDIFISHISSMDTLARGLLIAHDILENSDFVELRKQRYSSFDSGNGLLYEKGELGLEQLRNIAFSEGEPQQKSGKQELFESIINQYIR